MCKESWAERISMKKPTYAGSKVHVTVGAGVNDATRAIVAGVVMVVCGRG